MMYSTFEFLSICNYFICNYFHQILVLKIKPITSTFSKIHNLLYDHITFTKVGQINFPFFRINSNGTLKQIERIIIYQWNCKRFLLLYVKTEIIYDYFRLRSTRTCSWDQSTRPWAGQSRTRRLTVAHPRITTPRQLIRRAITYQRRVSLTTLRSAWTLFGSWPRKSFRSSLRWVRRQVWLRQPTSSESSAWFSPFPSSSTLKTGGTMTTGKRSR